MSENIGQFVSAAAQGDTDAMAKLYSKTLKASYFLAEVLTADSVQAAEITKKAYARAFCTVGKLKKPEAFEIWMKQTVASVYKETQQFVFNDAEAGAGESSTEFLPEEVYDDPARSAAALEAVAALKPELRTALVLHYNNGMPVQIIAKFLGVSESTANALLCKARASVALSLGVERSGSASDTLPVLSRIFRRAAAEAKIDNSLVRDIFLFAIDAYNAVNASSAKEEEPQQPAPAQEEAPESEEQEPETAEETEEAEEAVKNKMKYLKTKMNMKEATAKEENMFTSLQVVNEMMARGVKFLPVDVYNSDAKVYHIEDGKIRLPFSALGGCGGVAAEQLAAAYRAGKPLAVEAVERGAKYLGIAIGNVIKIACPDVVAIGGSFLTALPEYYSLIVTQARARRQAEPRFIPFAHGPIQCALGGVRLVIMNYFKARLQSRFHLQEKPQFHLR